MTFFPEVKLSKSHAEAIARGLFAIALSDGLHDREKALIASFWEDSGGSEHGLAELTRRDAITAEELGATLDTAELRQLFVKTGLLMAFADGSVSGEESKMVRGFAKSLGLENELPTLEAQVKEFLLSQLKHVHNVEKLAELAHQLAI